jgi:hypothetical protein
MNMMGAVVGPSPIAKPWLIKAEGQPTHSFIGISTRSLVKLLIIKSLSLLFLPVLPVALLLLELLLRTPVLVTLESFGVTDSK